MAKAITKKIKLQIPAGKATPAPPVGTVLGPAGINLQEFCTKFNDATRDKGGDVLPVEISIYEDRTFDFVLKTPPAAFLLKKVAKVKSGAAKGETVATITKDQLKEVAEPRRWPRRPPCRLLPLCRPRGRPSWPHLWAAPRSRLCRGQSPPPPRRSSRTPG